MADNLSVTLSLDVEEEELQAIVDSEIERAKERIIKRIASTAEIE